MNKKTLKLILAAALGLSLLCATQNTNAMENNHINTINESNIKISNSLNSSIPNIPDNIPNIPHIPDTYDENDETSNNNEKNNLSNMLNELSKFNLEKINFTNNDFNENAINNANNGNVNENAINNANNGGVVENAINNSNNGDVVENAINNANNGNVNENAINNSNNGNVVENAINNNANNDGVVENAINNANNGDVNENAINNANNGDVNENAINNSNNGTIICQENSSDSINRSSGENNLPYNNEINLLPYNDFENIADNNLDETVNKSIDLNLEKIALDNNNLEENAYIAYVLDSNELSNLKKTLNNLRDEILKNYEEYKCKNFEYLIAYIERRLYDLNARKNIHFKNIETGRSIDLIHEVAFFISNLFYKFYNLLDYENILGEINKIRSWSDKAKFKKQITKLFTIIENKFINILIDEMSCINSLDYCSYTAKIKEKRRLYEKQEKILHLRDVLHSFVEKDCVYSLNIKDFLDNFYNKLCKRFSTTALCRQYIENKSIRDVIDKFSDEKYDELNTTLVSEAWPNQNLRLKQLGQLFTSIEENLVKILGII